MAKPWKPASYNKPDTPKGQGAEGTEKGAEAAEKEMGETGFMGKSPPPRREETEAREPRFQ